MPSSEPPGDFDDGELGVFSSTLVIEEGLPILLVFHDEEGDWQFLSSHEEQADECQLLHVSHLLERDPTIRQVADLPVGWKAWRWSVDEAWIREVIPADQAQVSD